MPRMSKRALTFASRRHLMAAALAVPAAVAAARLARAVPGAKAMQKVAFDRERFVEDCVRAARERDSQAAVREVVARAVSDPAAVLQALGEPAQAGLDVLHRSPRLTIFAAKWTPQMNLLPHDHRMWALIGIYAGREDNILWRRTPNGIEATGARVLFPRNVAALPADVVHSVTNPLARFTGGLHIYGGDFFATARSQWDAETLKEEPSNGDTIRAMFERENERVSRCRED